MPRSSKYTRLKNSETLLDRKLDQMYDALLLLPCLHNYNDEDIKILSDILLALGNNEAFINFIILFSGKTIKIPEIDKIEQCIRIIIAYNDYIKVCSDNFENNLLIRTVFTKNKIPYTRENINIFKRIDRFLNKK